jgi:NADH:ubiquinone oxidoreductase subunit F (NADH-binding)/NADH:ubiquinone oxidoreductase subunit E
MTHPVIPISAFTAAPPGPRTGEPPPVRPVSDAALHDVRHLLGNSSRQRDLLIEHLHKIQDAWGHLSAEHLGALAQEMQLPVAEVVEVAGFYHHFGIVRDGESPPAALTVRVCDGLPCAMAGAGDLLARLPALLGTDVRVIASPCVGRCEKAPAVMVGQNPVAPARVAQVTAAVASRQVQPPVQPYLGSTDYAAYRASGGYRLFQDCLAGRYTVEDVLGTLESSGLRGLGGGGFPVGRKWRLVRAEPAPRLMALNIDEGEPGSFKDRVLLESDPHRFLEGALIAAWAVGVSAIYIYLRDEYHGCRELLMQEIDTLRQELPVADLPQIHLRRGAGAYICGEESAMLESIEGKRGLPRLGSAHVAQVGLFGCATLEHNFETVFWVRELLEKGGAWFAAQGRHGCHGLRSFSVSGRVRQPGLKLAPAGITARELIDEFCGGMQDGHTLYAYLPGGASGGILPAALADLPLDFDSLHAHGCFVGSAAVIVLSQHDRAADAARNMMRFFAQESCGQCAPCREGTARASALIDQPDWDRTRLADLSASMRSTSACGLGRSAPNTFDSVLRHFGHELR